MVKWTGYWFGKMVSVTLVPQLPHQLMIRSTHPMLSVQVALLQFMVVINFNITSITMACNLSFSSRCPMRSTTMEKGKPSIFDVDRGE